VLRIVPHFLEEPTTTAFQRALRIHGGTVCSYPQAIAWFLSTYVPERVVSSKLREVSVQSRRQGESVEEFALRLQAEAAQLGDLISERTLRTHFYAGLDAPTATFAQSLLPHGPVLQTFHEAVTHASQVDQSIMILRPSTAATVSARSVELSSRTILSRNRGILSIPDSTSMDEIHADFSGSLDIDTGVLSIIDQSSRSGKQFYCFVCWKQSHYAIDCPLIPESDKKEIAARKAEALALMRGRPGWQSRTGRIHPNVPYPGGVNPTTADTERHAQSKN
jgi:hypothetical protein